MCFGKKKDSQVSTTTAVQAVDADGQTPGDSGGKGPPMSEKDGQDMDKYNKELEASKDNFKNGPVGKRSITDCLCCLIFLVAIVGFGAASSYGYENGDPRLLLLGWDSDGNGCGYSSATEDYPYLYWGEAPSGTAVQRAISELNLLLAIEMLFFGVCVKECPSADIIEPIKCYPTSRQLSSLDYGWELGGLTGQDLQYANCQYTIGPEYFAEWGLESQFTVILEDLGVGDALRVPYRYPTFDLYGFCLPDLNSEYASAISDQAMNTLNDLFQEFVMNDQWTAVFADIAYCWKVLAVCSGTAVLLAYIYLIVIRYVGGILIWGSIAAIQLSLIAGAYYLWDQRDQYMEGDENRDWLKYAAYTVAGIAALFFLCICCCCRAIKLGIAVYKTTAQYIASNLRIFLLPALSYLIAFIWLLCWIVSALYVYSVGEPYPRPEYTFLTDIKWEDNTRYIMFYQVFMLFWINAFIMGTCQFIIAASACIWYFEVNSDTGGKGSVGRGMWWAIRYHLGSIAFGAFIIAVCQMLRFLFEYYRRKIQSLPKNPVVTCLLCYTRYLLILLEKCVKFITKNAYIQVALSNTFFCKAAWNAFCLILKNVARFGWLHTIGSILNWFGVLSVSGVNGFAAYIYMTNIDEYKTNVTQPAAPALIVLLVSFFIVKQFLSIFSFSLDAILQSFLLDESLGFGGTSRPDNMQAFKGNLEKYKK